MANVTNPTDMVAADQLFRAMLQQANTSIVDKGEEIEKLNCLKMPSLNTINNIDCNDCPIKSTCVNKDRLSTLKDDVNNLVDERSQLVQKYAELQDDIKSYLLS